MPEPDPAPEPPEHVRRNQIYWDEFAAPSYAAVARGQWARDEPVWGVFEVPESQVGMLPARLEGIDAVELGCGTGYVSAWLARRGARPVGVDNSAAQLATARAMQAEFGLEFPLLHGDAERVPLPDAGFDLAISEYGASLWCDPYAWIPEAARLLRPGGELVFFVSTALSVATLPDARHVASSDRLLRPLFGMHQVQWTGEEGVEFHLPHGEMLALLRRCGFEVTELQEIAPPAGSGTRYGHITLEWARQWPAEELWRARRIK